MGTARMVVGLICASVLSGPAAAQAPDAIFADDFATGDTSRWSVVSADNGDLAVSTAATLGGADFGLAAVVNDLTPLYVEDGTPAGEARYRARFYFDPGNFDPGEASGHFRVRIFLGFAEAPSKRLMTLVLKRSAGQYSLLGRVRRDDNTTADTPFVPITDEPHLIELDWRRSAAAAADGGFDLRIDNVLAASLAHVANESRGVDFVRLGALSIKAGASGTMRWARFESRRRSLIGRAARTFLEPGLLVLADNSGSMSASVGSANSCGTGTTRISHAKCAVRNFTNGYGDVMVGLARFHTTCAGSPCLASDGACSGVGSADILAPVMEDQADTQSWVDGVGTGCSSSCSTGGVELTVPAVGGTPLGGSLASVKQYLESGDGTFLSPIATDQAHVPPRDQCRRYGVVLITDGDETCGGNAVAAAAALRDTRVGGVSHDVRTYVIGFAGATLTPLNDIAAAGGTGTASSTANEAQLSPALSAIAGDLVKRDGCPCVFHGPEVCNGEDDDCNGLVDDGLTPPPPSFCSTAGSCTPAGAEVPRVCDSKLGRWVCQYGPDVEMDGVGNIVPETRCDGHDNDCNGVVDVSRDGVDVCATCVPSAEVCDGRDNDCDGLVDEPKATPGTNPSYVVEPLVRLGISTTYVEAYEASRPDATEASAGVLETRACARAGVLPWADVTATQAKAACAAAGLRLCTVAEWQSACRGATFTCGWGMQPCTSYTATACNGNDLDPLAGPPDDDLLLTTGSLPACYANWNAAGSIFDLSGNLGELTIVSATVNDVMGGSYRDTPAGMNCSFSFVQVDATFSGPATGFRCCSSTPP
jgi:hypothetical protein